MYSKTTLPASIQNRLPTLIRFSIRYFWFPTQLGKIGRYSWWYEETKPMLVLKEEHEQQHASKAHTCEWSGIVLLIHKIVRCSKLQVRKMIRFPWRHLFREYSYLYNIWRSWSLQETPHLQKRGRWAVLVSHPTWVTVSQPRYSNGFPPSVTFFCPETLLRQTNHDIQWNL